MFTARSSRMCWRKRFAASEGKRVGSALPFGRGETSYRADLRTAPDQGCTASNRWAAFPSCRTPIPLAAAFADDANEKTGRSDSPVCRCCRRAAPSFLRRPEGPSFLPCNSSRNSIGRAPRRNPSKKRARRIAERAAPLTFCMSSAGADGMAGIASSSTQCGMIGAGSSWQYGMTNGPRGFSDSDTPVVSGGVAATSTVAEAVLAAVFALSLGKTLIGCSSGITIGGGVSMPAISAGTCVPGVGRGGASSMGTGSAGISSSVSMELWLTECAACGAAAPVA